MMIYFKGPKWQRGSVSAFPYGSAAAGSGGAPPPSVSPRADGDTNTNADNFPVSCTVGCDFDADGNEYETTATGTQTLQTVWLDAGSAADVWVEFVRTAGGQTDWDTHTSSTRYNLASNRRFRMTVTRNTPGISNKNITGFFRMWDAASGGSTLWTGSTVEWRCTANYQQLDFCSTC